MKYYRTITEDGHIQLWKTLADIPKANKPDGFDEMEIDCAKEPLHALMTDLLDRLYAAEQRVVRTNENVASLMAITDDEPSEEHIDELIQEAVDTPLSYTEQSVRMDDLWDNLPIVRKLSFAADAMEQARSIFVDQGFKARDAREGGDGSLYRERKDAQ